MSYGVRYLEYSSFIRYCKKLNVKTNKDELEYYEKKGQMLPAARIVLPEEYIKRRHQWQHHISNEMPRLDQWPDLEKLNDRQLVLPRDFAQLNDEELIDSFDRALERNSPYILRPDSSNYQPWDSYRVVVKLADDDTITVSTAEHYYSYWQVHQLYQIQHSPDLYENRYLIDNLPDEVKQRLRLPRAYDPEVYRSFHGYARFFDALSFYLTMYYRERGRTFALIPELHGVQTLNTQQHLQYLNCLSNHARRAVATYSLTEQDLYVFLVQLLDLRRNYVDAERMKLAEELKNDIANQAQLIMGVTGKDWGEIADEVGKRARTKREFRQIAPVIGERDESQEILVHYTKLYSDELAKLNLQSPVRPLSESEIGELLDFCEDNELTLFSYTLSELVATEDEQRKFRRVVRYTNLKNLATSLEYFLKVIAAKKGVPLWESTLNPVIEEVMKNES